MAEVEIPAQMDDEVDPSRPSISRQTASRVQMASPGSVRPAPTLPAAWTFTLSLPGWHPVPGPEGVTHDARQGIVVS